MRSRRDATSAVPVATAAEARAYAAEDLDRKYESAARALDEDIRVLREASAGTRVPVDRAIDLVGEATEQHAGEEAFAEAAGGDLVEVTWGEQSFQPIPFNGIRVGPFKVATRVRKGETVAQAVARVHREMSAAVRGSFREQLGSFLVEYREMKREVEKAGL